MAPCGRQHALCHGAGDRLATTPIGGIRCACDQSGTSLCAVGRGASLLVNAKNAVKLAVFFRPHSAGARHCLCDSACRADCLDGGSNRSAMPQVRLGLTGLTAMGRGLVLEATHPAPIGTKGGAVLSTSSGRPLARDRLCVGQRVAVRCLLRVAQTDSWAQINGLEKIAMPDKQPWGLLVLMGAYPGNRQKQGWSGLGVRCACERVRCCAIFQEQLGW